MSKKIWMAAIGSLLLAATLATVVIAAPSQADLMDPPNPPGPRGGPGRDLLWGPPHLAGEITEIGDAQFTLATANNAEITIEVNGFTSYLGTLDSFGDLEVGLDVAVVGQRSGEGTLVARAVATREDLPLGTRLGGEVTAVGVDTLTIETRLGESFTFDVTPDTDFLSRENTVTSLGDIEVGDHVMVLFEQSTSGGLTANLILVGSPPTDAGSN